MIVGIEGKIEKKEPTFVHINVNGLIYEVNISLNTSAKITNKYIKLHTIFITKEDSQTLYGFYDISEKKMFSELIKINGVGPKVALAICSTFTPSVFAQIITNKDITQLKKVPGIGPKSASRLLVELSGVIIDETNTQTSNPNLSQAIMALESLGFKKEAINKIIPKVTANNTSDIIKQALKLLQK